MAALCERERSEIERAKEGKRFESEFVGLKEKKNAVNRSPHVKSGTSGEPFTAY